MGSWFHFIGLLSVQLFVSESLEERSWEDVMPDLGGTSWEDVMPDLGGTSWEDVMQDLGGTSWEDVMPDLGGQECVSRLSL